MGDELVVLVQSGKEIEGCCGRAYAPKIARGIKRTSRQRLGREGRENFNVAYGRRRPRIGQPELHAGQA